MTGTILAWQCIGCGRIDAPAPCVGVCSDRKVELVTAADHAEVLHRMEQLEEVVRAIATVTPRAGEEGTTYRALQLRARELLQRIT